MRKHFLILMLFTLLPLVGWAYDDVTFKVGDLVLEQTDEQGEEAEAHNAAVAAFLTYNAQDKALPTPYSIENEVIQAYVLDVAWYKTTTNGDEVVKTGNAIEKITDAGVYVCEFQVNYGNHQGSHSALLTIDKCMLTVSADDSEVAYGTAFNGADFETTFTGWPVDGDNNEVLSDEEKAALITAFGQTTIIAPDYVAFETGVGEYEGYIIPVVTGLVSDNYDFVEDRGDLTVTAKNFAETELTITVDNRFYNGSNDAPSIVVKDAANPDKTLVLGTDYDLLYFTNAAATTAYEGEGAPIHVGNYYIKVTGTGEEGANYTGTNATIKTYKVRPERLEFTLKEPTILYDAQQHNLTTMTLYTIEGLADVDHISSIAVVLQDEKPNNTDLQDLASATVKNVAKRTLGYKIKSITPTFTENDHVAEAGDYTVVILTENFKISPSPIEITFKGQQAHADEVAAWKAGKSVTNENKDEYLIISSATPLRGEGEFYASYPKVVATGEGVSLPLSFATEKQGNVTVQLYPVIKVQTGVQVVEQEQQPVYEDVSKNYVFNLTPGTLEVIVDLGTLYVRPLAETYGTYGIEKGYVKVEVVGGEAADNAALANLLNNKKVTPKVYNNADNAEDPLNGKTVNVGATEDDYIEYPNAATYAVAYDPSIFESDTWQTLTQTYDINLTGRPNFTINKAPLKIKLNDQSLNGATEDPEWAGDTKAALVADNKTVEFTGIVDVDLVDGEIPEALYQAVHDNFMFAGHVLDNGMLNGGKLTTAAINYDNEKVNDTDEATTPGYFRNAISVDAEHLVFDNYKYIANEDVTKGALYVSAYDNNFSLDEADDDVDETLEEANTNKKAVVKITLRRDQDLVSGEGADAQVLHQGKWAAKKWNTMVLPFDVTVAELSQQLGYAIVNVVNPEKTTGTNIAFRLEMNEIPANTPFTVKTNKGIGAEKELTFLNKTIKYVAEPSVEAGGQGYTFNANYAGLTIDKESDGLLKFLYGDLDGWGRVLADKDYSWDIMPFAAYIDLTEATDPNAAREVTFTMEEIDGSTTTIRNISVDTASKLKNATEGWYTIDGIRLQGAPTEKGIYINNGKKVVLK